MPSRNFFDSLELPPTADFHVHVRDPNTPMNRAVTPTIIKGGCDLAYIMPNTSVPITTVSAALEYKACLQALAPSAQFLMTLYLHPSLTAATIAEAAAAGIVGVKAYPAGVTTNSYEGVVNWDIFHDVFEAMQEHGLVLNLHGEVPFSSSAFHGSAQGRAEVPSVLNAEPLFLPTLHKLHATYPRLKIVLEHATTEAALEAVAKCGNNVALTVTAHHLWMTTDDVVGDAYKFCKPVAKTMADRLALLRAAMGVAGKKLRGRVFFGSDSAPHPLASKTPAPGQKPPAGCFTQPHATQLVVAAVEHAISEDWLPSLDDATLLTNLRGFLSEHGRKFYGIQPDGPRRKIVLERNEERIPFNLLSTNSGEEVKVPHFGCGTEVPSLRWVDA